MKKKPLAPVRKNMCATCPFRKGSAYNGLAMPLAQSALSAASRVCHSTGSNSINHHTGKPERLCRGARDLQIAVFHSLGFIEEPTDAAWEKKCNEMGLTHKKSK